MTKLAVYMEGWVLPAVVDVLENFLTENFSDIEEFVLYDNRTDETVPLLVLGNLPEKLPLNWVKTLSQKQILSNPAALTELTAALNQLLKPMVFAPLSYTVVDSLTPEQERKLGNALVVDIETGGDFDKLLPQEKYLISLAINDGKSIYVFTEEALTRTSVRTQLIKIFAARKLIAHNMKFDFRTIGANWGVEIYGHLDTLLLVHAVNPGTKKFDLKDVCHRYLGAPDWETAKEKYINKSKGLFYDNIPREILYEYNAYDVYWTWHLYQYLAKAAENNENVARVAKFEFSVANLFQDVEAAGFAVDPEYMEMLAEGLEAQSATVLVRLRQLVGQEDFNPRSPIQVKAALSALGLELKSTKEDLLAEAVESGKYTGKLLDVIADLLEYRGLQKQLGTYVRGVQKRMHNNMIYPTFMVHGTNTGRLSCANPNVQNWPRDVENDLSIRRIFVPRAEGRSLVAVDYSQAELRVMACMSNDAYLISLFQPGMPDFFDSLMPIAFPRHDLDSLGKETKKNLRAKLKACVPLDTKILTRRGWLTYNEVRIGDETPGFMPDGTTRWTRITKVIDPFDDEVLEWGHSGWKARANALHRWATQRNRGDKSTITMKPMIDVVSDDKVLVSGTLSDAPENELSLEEVRILSWLASGGCVSVSRALLLKAGLFSASPDYEGFILSLTPEQRIAWLDTFWEAEGHMMGGTRVITQKRGAKLDAVILAASLIGYNVSVNPYKDNDCVKVVLRENRTVTTQTMKMRSIGTEKVWCVATELGTWTAKQDDRVFVTGNTIYGLSYGRKEFAIAKALKMPVAEAKAIITNYFKAAPEFYEWRQVIEAKSVDPNSTLVSPFGRYYQSEIVTSRNRQNVINAGLAFLPQSTSSDICLTAALDVHAQIKGSDSYIVATVHDSIVLDVPDEQIQFITDITQKSMRDKAFEVFQAVPFATDASFGKSWEGI